MTHHTHINSWKDAESAFTQQLARNIEELNGTFPPHWVHFIEHIDERTDIQRIVDIGCGAGAYCYISKELGFNYVGYDYSEHAVNLATKQWQGEFICKDYKDITSEDIKEDDLVVANALCDVLPNGDECLKHLLNIVPNHLLVQRVRITQLPNFFREYRAYGIMTYEFYHNKQELEKQVKSAGYELSYHNLYGDNVFDLELNR